MNVSITEPDETPKAMVIREEHSFEYEPEESRVNCSLLETEAMLWIRRN